jgi:hypothetical protein
MSAKAGLTLLLTMLVFSVLSVIDDLTLGGRLVAQEKALGDLPARASQRDGATPKAKVYTNEDLKRPEVTTSATSPSPDDAATALPKIEMSREEIVRTVMPAVVTIETDVATAPASSSGRESS